MSQNLVQMDLETGRKLAVFTVKPEWKISGVFSLRDYNKIGVIAWRPKYRRGIFNYIVIRLIGI